MSNPCKHCNRTFATSVLTSAVAYAECVLGNVDDPAICLVHVRVFQNNQLNYVTQNPDGSITFHGNELMADVEACL